MAEKYDDWVVERKLSRGGQAVTYVVRREDDPSNELFVLKRLVNLQRLDRAEREIEAGARLDHPNILKLVTWNLQGKTPYIVSEFCEGGNLAELYETSDPSLVVTLRMFSEICYAVGVAHEQGVIHRDIKPDNIFLRADKLTPVVGDFGLCFIEEEETGARLTVLDEVVGPRWFMAPEVELGRVNEVSATSDVYSLGKLLYWLLTGKRLPREDHHEPDYDLTTDRRAAYIFIQDLLDKILVRNAASRLSDASLVARETDEVIRKIAMNSHAIGKSIPQLCNYCGVGTYGSKVETRRDMDSGNEAHTLDFADRQGFKLGGEWADWLIMVCNYCGNVQWFRPDMTENRDIWNH